MGQGALMEPSLERSPASSGADARFISVVVPVVERADDLVAALPHLRRASSTPGARSTSSSSSSTAGSRRPPELAALSQERDNLRFLRFARAFGETAALRLGIERSRGDVILTLPAYFQVKPEGVGTLLDALSDETDMVVASRSPRIDSWLNRLQSVAFNRMIAGVTDRPFHDIACGVRVMRRTVAEGLPLYGDLHRFIPALALREGYRVSEVAVPQHPSNARTRLYGPGRLRPPAARHRGVLLPRQVHREAAPLLRPGGLRLLPRRRDHLAGAAGRTASRARASPTGRCCCSRSCCWRWACSSWDSAWSARSSSICARRTAGPIGSASGRTPPALGQGRSTGQA